MVYRIGGPYVTSEVIDGEAIIVNLQSGCYYSLRGSGADVWLCLQKPMPAESIIDFVKKNYTGDDNAIKAAVQDLLRQLEAEQLIVSSEDTASHVRPADKERPVVFELPVLEKYTDMQALLLLDPIHDVGQTGWPAAKAEK